MFMLSYLALALVDQDFWEMANEGSNTETLAPVESHIFEVMGEVSLSVLLGLLKYFISYLSLSPSCFGYYSLDF